MRIGTETGRLAVSGAAMALLLAAVILSGPGTAFALANQTVLCQGTITNSTDTAALPIGPIFSVGNVMIKGTPTKTCATTITTVTQVTQNTEGCNGQIPCVVTLTETNSVPLSGTGCGPSAPTPGITVSNITASSNPDLVGCSQTSVADTFSSSGGAYTMILTPTSGSTCKAAGTGGFTICTSYSQ
jgi:hypothetical protein